MVYIFTNQLIIRFQISLNQAFIYNWQKGITFMRLYSLQRHYTQQSIQNIDINERTIAGFLPADLRTIENEFKIACELRDIGKMLNNECDH